MTTRKVVDLAEARERRQRMNRIDDSINRTGDGVYRVEKNRLAEGLKAKFECVLACPYEDLQQFLEVVLDALIALRSERDVEEPEAS